MQRDTRNRHLMIYFCSHFILWGRGTIIISCSHTSTTVSYVKPHPLPPNSWVTAYQSFDNILKTDEWRSEIKTQIFMTR